MRWTIIFALALSACTSSPPARRSPKTTAQAPSRHDGSATANAWWRGNPYVTVKNGQFIVGNLAMVRGDFASLIAMPTIHPEKPVDMAILKAILLKIREWLSQHSGQTLCEAVIQLRSTCNEAVDGVFKQLPQLQSMRAKLDFYTGNKAKDFSLCAHEQTFHPLVICTIDWKRTYENKDVCLAYAICVAGYTKLVSFVRTHAQQEQQAQ